MNRAITIASLTLTLFGCAERQVDMQLPQQPEPHHEMRHLSRFLGTWDVTMNMDIPGMMPTEENADGSATEEAAVDADHSADTSVAMSSGITYRYVLGNHTLRADGWHQVGDGEKSHFVEYMRWNPDIKKYQLWYFDDFGNQGTGTAWFKSGRVKFCTKVEMRDHDGKVRKGRGEMTFNGDDRIRLVMDRTEHGLWQTDGHDRK